MLVSLDDSILSITLNRPDAFNSFNDEMGQAFVEALDQADEPAVRCVVITGEGRAFCAGEDLRALSADYESGKPPDLGDILRARYIPAIKRIVTLPKPVIGALNGVAAGAGVSVALACDHRIASESASFVLAFAGVGLVPDAGATWLLPKYLGIGRALELALSTDKVDAAKSLEWGLVNEVVAPDDFSDRVKEKATLFAAGPTMALGATKELTWKATGGYLEKHLEAEADAQSTAGKTADHMEGVKAFFEKRPPNFEGR